MSDALARLQITRRFDAAPESVFDAWTDPKTAGRWLFTSPASESHDTDLDVRAGGKWTIRDRRDGVDYTAIGVYLEVDQPRLLAFTFGMPQFAPGFATVTVTFEADAGGCLMTLVQDSVPPDSVEPLREGWAQMFDALAEVLG